MKHVVAFDTETWPIGEDAVFPKVVCLTYTIDGRPPKIITILKRGQLLHTVQDWLLDRSTILVGHNVGFDLHCLLSTFPELEELIWRKLERGEITDTRIREKLLNLSIHGAIDKITLPSGQTKNFTYSLADLVKSWIGDDLSEDKHGEETWRTNYHLLQDFPLEDWPDEAIIYALNDAAYTYQIYQVQERRRSDTLGASLNTDTFQTASDFVLKYLTRRGIRIDRPAVQTLLEDLQKEISPEKLTLLVESGILRPPEPPRPYKNGKGMTKGKPASINRKRLLEIVQQVAKSANIELRLTEKGKVSADAEMIKELAPFSPELRQYQERQKIYRLITTELPKIDADFVYPDYDVLKETGRTSSFGGKLYPSTNVQQVDPRARHLFLPREGMVLCSIDYDAIELVSLAQTLLDLFGESRLADLLREGKDPHAFLGAQLALHFDPDFAAEVEDLGLASVEEEYQHFVSKKSSDDPKDREFYAHWRKFAKPTGLGYPGGLGPATMVEYAKAVYDISITEEQASDMRELWFRTFPEMRSYFKFISSQANENDEFSYDTPLGMRRSGATYCAMANGFGLQSRTAEGAKMALFHVVRACYDPSQKSALYRRAFPLAFIHDEILLEIVEDDRTSLVADTAAKIWREWMQKIMPDIPVRAEPALMRRWNKKAETIRDEKGHLLVWEEPEDGGV